MSLSARRVLRENATIKAHASLQELVMHPELSSMIFEADARLYRRLHEALQLLEDHTIVGSQVNA
jgi:hypothetical protein